MHSSTGSTQRRIYRHSSGQQLRILPVNFTSDSQQHYHVVGEQLPDAPTLTIPLVIAGKEYRYSLKPDFDRVLCKRPLMFWLDGSLDDSIANNLPLQVCQIEGELIIQHDTYPWMHALATICRRELRDPAVAAEYESVCQQIVEALPQIETHVKACARWVKPILGVHPLEEYLVQSVSLVPQRGYTRAYVQVELPAWLGCDEAVVPLAITQAIGADEPTISLYYGTRHSDQAVCEVANSLSYGLAGRTPEARYEELMQVLEIIGVIDAAVAEVTAEVTA